MRDSKRIPIILDELKRIWEAYPDLRLGQLILNFGPRDPALYYIEDEDLINYMKTNIYNQLKRMEGNINGKTR